MEVKAFKALLNLYKDFTPEERKTFITQDAELLQRFRRKRLANGSRR